MSCYSVDLRKRVVRAVRAGMTRTKASEIFKVCRKTIYSWLSLEERTGSLEPQTGFQKGHSHGITDLDVFRKYIDAHPDYTQEEASEHFSVGRSTIGRTLKKIGYSRKKRAKPMPKDVKKNAKHILKL